MTPYQASSEIYGGFFYSGITLRSTDLALKSARILDLCGESSVFADLENTVDRGSAAIFYADSGLCLSHAPTLGPKGILNHRSFFSLDRYVNEFIETISNSNWTEWSTIYNGNRTEWSPIRSCTYCKYFSMFTNSTILSSISILTFL